MQNGTYAIYLRKSRKDSEFNKEESIEKTLERHEKMLQNYAKSVFGCKIPEEKGERDCKDESISV